MAVVEEAHRYCKQIDQVVVTGKDMQREVCNKSFLLEYAYEAYKVGVTEQIVDMAMNGSGVRGTMRVLKVGINTVIRTLKNAHRK